MRSIMLLLGLYQNQYIYSLCSVSLARYVITCYLLGTMPDFKTDCCVGLYDVCPMKLGCCSDILFRILVPTTRIILVDLFGKWQCFSAHFVWFSCTLWSPTTPSSIAPGAPDTRTDYNSAYKASLACTIRGDPMASA